MPVRARVIAVPLILRVFAVELQRRAPQIMGELLITHGLLEYLAEIAAGQQDQAIHAVGAQFDPFPHMQAEMRIVRQARADGKQVHIIVGRQGIGNGRERVRRQFGGHGQIARAHAAGLGCFEQRLQIRAGDAPRVRLQVLACLNKEVVIKAQYESNERRYSASNGNRSSITGKTDETVERMGRRRH